MAASRLAKAGAAARARAEAVAAAELAEDSSGDEGFHTGEEGRDSVDLERVGEALEGSKT
jgi:hypothetical protein